MARSDEPGRDGSLALRDGYLRLAAGMLIQAVTESRSRDILQALDALDYLLTDAPLYTSVLDLCDDPRKALRVLILGGKRHDHSLKYRWGKGLYFGRRSRPTDRADD